nr:immunoglobulin light chain junction region [Macaca mulatta]MOY04522.1 immunoglobulin light chain junction region [Macaca mulatta]
CLQNTQLPLTF